MITRLYETVAPSVTVTGQSTTAIGIANAFPHSMFIPAGVFMAVENSGLRPCVVANGTHPIPHIAWTGSGPSPTYVVVGARQVAIVMSERDNNVDRGDHDADGHALTQARHRGRATVIQTLAATSSTIRRKSSTASGSIASASATNGVTSNTVYTASAVRAEEPRQQRQGQPGDHRLRDGAGARGRLDHRQDSEGHPGDEGEPAHREVRPPPSGAGGEPGDGIDDQRRGTPVDEKEDRKQERGDQA